MPWCDPIEDDPFFPTAFAEAEAHAERVLKDVPRGLGFCHQFWFAQKAYLKEKYGMDWKTPAEANPGVMFD